MERTHQTDRTPRSELEAHTPSNGLYASRGFQDRGVRAPSKRRSPVLHSPSRAASYLHSQRIEPRLPHGHPARLGRHPACFSAGHPCTLTPQRASDEPACRVMAPLSRAIQGHPWPDPRPAVANADADPDSDFEGSRNRPSEYLLSYTGRYKRLGRSHGAVLRCFSPAQDTREPLLGLDHRKEVDPGRTRAELSAGQRRPAAGPLRESHGRSVETYPVRPWAALGISGASAEGAPMPEPATAGRIPRGELASPSSSSVLCSLRALRERTLTETEQGESPALRLSRRTRVSAQPTYGRQP